MRSTLAGLIHPLDKSQLEQHRELVNIYTGEYSELDSTIYRAAEIGRDQHKRFEEALPDGFELSLCNIKTGDSYEAKKET